MNSVTHVAGHKVEVAGRTIQRCALCGDKLIDDLNEARPEGSGPTPTWEPGRLVRVTAGNPQSSVLLPDTDQLPDDSCIDLVEE
jgi:hypothetical protein